MQFVSQGLRSCEGSRKVSWVPTYGQHTQACAQACKRNYYVHVQVQVHVRTCSFRPTLCIHNYAARPRPPGLLGAQARKKVTT